MRTFPNLRKPAESRQVTTIFGGYDHNAVIGENEFYNMKNMTSDLYPAAAVRKARSAFEHIGGAPLQDCIALHHRDDRPVTCDGHGNIYCGGSDPAHTLSGLLDMDEVWDEECSVPGVKVQVNKNVFRQAFGKNEVFWPAYVDKRSRWEFGGNPVQLADYGITVSDTPTGWPQEGDTIRVVYYDGVMHDNRKKQIVSMGAWCLIWPDKVYFNAVKLANGDEMEEGVDYGHMEAAFHGDRYVHTYLCDVDGTEYVPEEFRYLGNKFETGMQLKKGFQVRHEATEGGESFEAVYEAKEDFTVGDAWVAGNWEFKKRWMTFYSSDREPEEPESGDYWLDTASRWTDRTATLKQFAESTGTWTPVGQVYTKIYCEGIGADFEKDDFLNISVTSPNTAPNVRDQLAGMTDGSWQILRCEENLIVFNYAGMMQSAIHDPFSLNTVSPPGAVYSAVDVKRNMPQLDYVVECGNRLWGCYYGEKDGEHINEIYASKLGSFKNWNAFAGISTDSYVASRGADGKYTGAAVLNNNPLFFREHSFEKVYPATNGAHQITTVSYPGIQEGSWMSPVVIEGTLYYKGTDGVYAYTGSVPRLISSPLGGVMYYDAVAAPLGRKYYISMRDADGEWNLFVWDISKGLWHREDETQFHFAAEYKGCLYFITKEAHGWRIGDVGTSRNVPWMIETGDIGISTPDQKRVSRIVLRLKLELGAEAKISVQYDSSGRWHDKMTLHGNGLRTMVAPIVPIRCDHMKIRMSGKGGLELYSIAYSLEQGSDVP